MEKIKTLKQLKRAITLEKKDISEKEMFISKIYSEYLTTMIKGFIPFFSGNVKIYEGNEDEIAYTEGLNNFINLKSFLLKDLSIKDKNKMMKGLNLHEIGHLLFTDFKLSKTIQEKLNENKFYPSFENDELMEFIMKSERNKAIISNLYHNIANIIEDGYVDRIIRKLAPGYSPYLAYLYQKDLESSFSFDMMMKMKMDNVSIFINSCLHYARFGKHTYSEDAKSELIDQIKKAEDIIRNAVFEYSPIKRAKYSWAVLALLFNFLKDELEKKEEMPSEKGEKSEETSESSSDGSPDEEYESSSDGSPDEESSSEKSPKLDEKSSDEKESTPSKSTKEDGKTDSKEEDKSSTTTPPSEAEDKSEELADALEKASKLVPKDSTKRVGTPSSISKEASELAKSLKDIETPDIDASETKEDLDKVLEDIAKEIVEEKQEKAIEEALSKDSTKDCIGIHSKVKPHVFRTPVNKGKREYEVYHKELDIIVTRFVRDFIKEIEERQIGSTQRGLYFGKRLSVEQVYRKDKRIFQNKIAPEEIPDMAVGVLVDLSGSMGGTKEIIARKCAYITYMFCQKLNIPCFVIGHDVDFSSGVLRLSVAADESCIDRKDKIRIMGLQAHGDNRDGYALRYCYRKLEQIEAETKVLLVISDGQPSDNSTKGCDYYGEFNGGSDMRNAVSQAMKKGIETIVAGLGSDAPRIKNVYKKGLSDKNSATFLDCSDVNKLPKSFIKILKEMLE